MAETFWGLTSTGWTAIGSVVSALSLASLVIYNILSTRLAVSSTRLAVVALEAQTQSIRVQIDSVVYSGCPVLILREKQGGEVSLYNCGSGPALMVQWGYGKSIPEAKIMHRLEDNIIPAKEERIIPFEKSTARAFGVVLFAYGVTNDKFVTSISWPQGTRERRVHFGLYEGQIPKDLE